MKEGLSGSIAKAFIQSKLTILLMIGFLLVGAYSTLLIPREEEPQIDVPMADIFIRYEGASPKEVEARIVQPLEKIVSNIHGVEYVYATAMQGQAMLIVQFYVGEDIERSIVKLYNELMKNMDKMPQGASMPLVKTRSIDDVPALSLTLWSEKYGDDQLRQMAQSITHELKQINQVAEAKIIGGRVQQLIIEVDKTKLIQHQLDLVSIQQALAAQNHQVSAGTIINQNQQINVSSGFILESEEDAKNLIVGVNNNQPVYLHQIASIKLAAAQAQQYVFYGEGAFSKPNEFDNGVEFPAVTIAIAKKKGADAMVVAETITEKIELLKQDLITNDVQLTVTRNYGETASEKVSELLLHLVAAIVAVTAFVMLAMGWRGGLVVFLSVPVTFALTLFSYYFLDYTLNRITLFALVFITGIVVDDSIIIAENMHRHFKMKKLPFLQAAIFSINEVGNPTILATFTVIAAVLPMAFVTGMMGPYMSPMPIGASIAMLLSLIVALTLTPYLGYLFLREKDDKKDEHEHVLEKSAIYKLYKKILDPMLLTRWKRWAFMIGTVVILLGSMVFFYTKWVAVKMLPFDNKNEFQVVIDMPEGTSLEQTYAVTQEVSRYLATYPLVKNYQGYVGTAGPISFNGLVRHYDLRNGGNVAEIQVNLADKKERDLQSHDIVKELRAEVQRIGKRYDANIKLVELPPGPPVLSTIVAEVYGPDYEQQIKIAKQLQSLLERQQGVVDIDDMTEAEHKEIRLNIDAEKAMKMGIAPVQINQNVQAALSGISAGMVHREAAYEPVPVMIKLPDVQKSEQSDLLSIPVKGSRGNVVLAGVVAKASEEKAAQPIYRKNQQRVVFVLADMAGELESPFYAINSLGDSLKNIQVPKGYELREVYAKVPNYHDQYTIKWDGEWQITLEVFRDLGIAFVVVLIFIYMLIVGWFQNFSTPLIMLVAIPLSLIGIVLGHWMLDAYFTATSMIGFIALAGVMVRNSVLLIDFINIRLNEGVELKQAIIEAGAVRTTPILLTAGAVVLGAVIILFDPIFQGLAISLMGGTITSTILTLVVVPLLYFKMKKNNS